MKPIDNDKIYNGIVDRILIELNSCGADFHRKMKENIPGKQKMVYAKIICEPEPDGYDFTPGILDFFHDLPLQKDNAVRFVLVQLDFDLDRSVYNYWIKIK